jgi:hypothetical protein
MLPAPRGTFSSVGEKVLNELRHFALTESQDKRVILSVKGSEALQLLQKSRFTELRRLFVQLHLETYDNLLAVVEYLASGAVVLRPMKENLDLTQLTALARSYLPWEGDKISFDTDLTPQKAEELITTRLLEHCFPNAKLTVPIFRSMCDRLASLRLINQSRVSKDGADGFAIYGTCSNARNAEWDVELSFTIGHSVRLLFLSEFSLDKKGAWKALASALERAFHELKPEGGFYDLPDVRDRVCLELRIPEAAFDNAVSEMLDSPNPPISLGLRYERITGRRKPMVRQPGNQIFNLIRPTS